MQFFNSFNELATAEQSTCAGLGNQVFNVEFMPIREPKPGEEALIKKYSQQAEYYERELLPRIEPLIEEERQIMQRWDQLKKELDGLIDEGESELRVVNLPD